MKPVEPHDFDEIAGWYKARQIQPLDHDFYGKVGMIEPGVAAGFLTLTDSRCALLENFITNPVSWSKQRHAAVVQISDALEEEARTRGYKKIIAITKVRGIGTSALGHGFQCLGTCDLYGKELIWD